MEVIRLVDISKCYENNSVTKDSNILKEASYTFINNKFYSIIGRSGLGKSTLLRIIGTVEKADEGSVYINDKNIMTSSEKEKNQIRRDVLGFIFQDYNLINRYSIKDNLMLPMVFRGNKDYDAMENKIVNSLKMVGISVDKLNQSIRTLSGGEKQRVAIGRALINNPQIILADEPTGNLDEKNEDRIIDLLAKIKAETACTIIMVTHSLKLARMSDTTLTIVNQKIVEAEVN